MSRIAFFARNSHLLSRNVVRRTLSANAAKITDPALNTSATATVTSGNRLQELRERLANEPEPSFAAFSVSDSEEKYDSAIFSKKAKAFLTSVNELYNKKYSRGGANGEGFVGVEEVLEKAPYYSEAAKASLLRVAPEVQQQMRVKVSEAYVKHALEALPANAVEPSPILKVIVPDELEVMYREVGETDPSNQNKYSPMSGLLHKYNMLLAMTSINCSSHCRYCYRSDLFNGSSGKSKADLVPVAKYVKAYNGLIEEAANAEGSRYDEMAGAMVSKEGEPLLPLREILLSGGDPLTLPNSTLARYLVLMAEAGMRTVRFGSKEVAFNPNRFDHAFWSTLDLFHENYPEVRVELVGHYVHPYELVRPMTDNNGKYLYDTTVDYTVHPDVKACLDHMNARRSWFGHFNQFPIIAGVNDQPNIMRLLLHLTNKLGIGMHNVYACREVIGNPHFRGDLTIDRQYDLLEAAKIGLSGLENHARLIMSTEQGKMDVLGHKEGKVYMRLNRFVHGRKPENTMVIVDQSKIVNSDGSNKFFWLSNDVIASATDEAGRRMLLAQDQPDNDTRFIKSVKAQAAAIATGLVDAVELSKPEAAVAAPVAPVVEEQVQEVTIQVFDKEGATVEVLKSKLGPSTVPGETVQSVAELLVEAGHAEMVCGGQLSCTTCVGKVRADYKLSPASLDEMDATDTLDISMDGEAGELRACCQVKAQAGQSYSFTQIE